ncbi:GPI mannosyltransferase 1 [Coemansia helicoidea]|uniref:GPI mannosyltransferase 1 n=1 Tax=Coemansia helicoidea TaxID=1286919 RepID=A0ACC1KPU6_9FUNG|nr:GPI mannosyltransferase 1 [Coemansia helicoidea]
MLVYGLWQDAHMTVKYTDIDYSVFTDAARSVWEGGSPYERSTYRYTPVLAWLLTPNIWLHPTWGKWLFVACDCLVGALIARIVRARGASDGSAAAYAALWLLNPQVANISTRGSAESVVCAAVVATLYAFQRRRVVWGSALFGLSVHLKIYPAIYAVPLLCVLDNSAFGGGGSSGRSLPQPTARSRLVALFNVHRITFAAVSGATFLALTAAMYGIYGYEFLDETYLYHVTRRDHRHNYSAWFLPIYLTFASPTSVAMGLLTFLPQVATVAVLGLAFGRDLYFAAFAQTFAFVAYNKVCTAQYFMWYICLLPVVWPHSAIRLVPRGLLLVAAWIGPQALYLQQAYRLEFLGENSFALLWAAGALIFVTNCWILNQIISNQQIVPLFSASTPQAEAKKRK